MAGVLDEADTMNLRVADRTLLRSAKSLFGLDIRLANDAAVLVNLLAHIDSKLGAAGSDWKQPLLGELRLHLGGFEPRAEQACQVQERVRRRLRRRHDPVENVRLVLAHPGLGEC